jgi:hypothetical protein
LTTVPTVPPPVARLAVDPDDPARLRVANPLGDQAHVLLLLFRLHPARRRPSPESSSLVHHNLQTALVLRRSLESARVGLARAREQRIAYHPDTHPRLI